MSFFALGNPNLKGENQVLYGGGTNDQVQSVGRNGDGSVHGRLRLRGGTRRGETRDRRTAAGPERPLTGLLRLLRLGQPGRGLRPRPAPGGSEPGRRPPEAGSGAPGGSPESRPRPSRWPSGNEGKNGKGSRPRCGGWRSRPTRRFPGQRIWRGEQPETGTKSLGGSAPWRSWPSGRPSRNERRSASPSGWGVCLAGTGK